MMTLSKEIVYSDDRVQKKQKRSSQNLREKAKKNERQARK